MQIGNTALHHSAHQGHVDIVDLLLEKGASINLQNKVDVEFLGRHISVLYYVFDVVSFIPVPLVSLWYMCAYWDAVVSSKKYRPAFMLPYNL